MSKTVVDPLKTKEDNLRKDDNLRKELEIQKEKQARLEEESRRLEIIEGERQQYRDTYVQDKNNRHSSAFWPTKLEKKTYQTEQISV